MYKSMRLLFLALITIASLVFGPVSPVYAASLPAEINKQFTPDFIDAGGVSRLRITIFNPNTFPLSNAAWSDNLVGVQPGLSIANPPNVSHTCGLGAVVTAVAGSTTISLANGAVSPQVGVNPGECYVEVDVTATLPGARINTIPAGNLTSQGVDGVTPVTVSNTTPASATLTVVAVAPPSLSKAFSPNTIYIGEVSQLTIRVNNNDVDTNLTNVKYTDTLPVGLVLATPVSPVVSNCGTYTLVAAAGTNTIALSGATVTPGQDCLVTVNVTGTAGIYTNTIPAGPVGPGSLTTQQGVTNGSPASADLNVQPVSIQKIFAPGTITAGGTSVLTITLQNPSGTPYTNVSLTDNLPAGLTVSGTPATTCGGSLTNNATSITLTGGTIPASATPPTLSTCTITATVLANLSISGTRTNTIPANSLITNVPGVTNLFPASGNLNVNAALTGTKAYSPTTMVLGGSSTVTIVLANNSATPLTGVNFTDTMPSNLTVFGTPATPQCNGGTIANSINSVTLTGGSIPANSTCTIVFNVTSTVPGSGTTYENTIPANAISTTEGPKNTSIIRTGTDLTVVNAYTLPVGVSKNFQTDPISPGSTSRLRITITAPVDTALSGLTVIDNLVSGLVIAASPAPTESCPGGTLTAVAGTNFIKFTNLTANVLAANASCNIDVWVTSTVPGTYSNVIPATTITSDQGRTNLTDSNTATLTVTGMTMSKAFYPTVVQAGGHSTLVITLVNTSDAPLINLQVTDDLPGIDINGLTVAPIPNASTTCGPGTVTAIAGTQAITLTGGVIPAQTGGVPGTCTITVDVQGNDSTPLTGTSYTNSIPVTKVSALVQSVGVTIRPQSPAEADLGVQPLTFNITKSIDPVFVYGGAHSTLSISLLNPNNTDLTGITFTDNMPSNMKIFDPPAFDIGTCGGVITGTPGDTSFSFSGGVLAANSNCTLSLRVVMNIEGTITNQIDAGDVTTNNGVSNPQPVAASLTNLPGVSVKKSFNPSAIMAGNPSTLIITITNTTNINVVNMGLTDNLPTALPTGLVVATPANASTTCSGATLTASPNDTAVVLSGGNLNGFQSCIIQVDVTSSIPGIFINTIGVGQLAAQTEGSGLPVNNNDPASDTLTVTSSTFSLGNRVWYDTDNSGTINGTETGINGVTVQLYAADISGNPTGGVLGTKVTANGGYYRFDDLAAGDYVVVIPSPQLQTGGPLAGYWSSGTTLGALGVVGEATAPDPDNDTDVDDNGTLQPGGDVLSKAITLGPTANEPTNDADANPANPAGESANNQSNRTVDFGFYRMQLGNQIFIDVNGNGTFDGGDAAMPGALVQLYAGDGTELITGADGIRGTVDDGYGPDGVSGNGDDGTGGVLTGASGTYLFSALPAGDYYVGVTPAGGGYLSTIDTFSVPDSTDPDANINNNDNGVGTSSGKVLSATVTLTPGGFGAALSNNVANATGTTSNPTLDFGFVLPGFSLGNRVWFDTDNSSTINGTEVGVDDVTVQLFAADINGNPTGSAIGTQLTVNGGYYRFDNLNPGTYVVVLPASNFTLTGKLYKYWSSGTTVLANSAVSETAAPDPDDNTDSDDNGTRQIGGAFNYAVISKPVTLEPVASEPTNDTDADPTNPAGEAVNNQSNRTVDFGFYRTDVGDQIFLDVNQNGTYDVGTDSPLSGAVVRLYTNNNIEVNVGLDGILGTSDDIPGGVLTTASGTYLFSGLPQGNYIVKVTPPSGFSSTIDTFDSADSADPDTNTNNNDNGIGNGMGQVASGILTMTPGETGANITTANASGTTSDPSVDFGFVPGYSLGNRVWFDTNNNRTLDLLEVGVDDVLVQLYAADGSGNPVGAVLGSTFTLGGGYYRFDNLPAGDYVVVIPADNFIDDGLNDILVGYLSSGTTLTSSGGLSEVVAPDPDNNVDLDDNGARQLSGNVVSRAVTLGSGIVEPLLEADPVTNPSLGEAPDGQSNRTVDFGFYRQQLGDQIFSDLDGDGMFTAADAPLAGATVKLYASDGVTEINVGPDGILGTTDDAAGGVTTIADGKYLFGGLPEGSYIVKVTPLTGYSTIDNGNVPAEDDSLNPNLNLDNNDNGHGVSTGEVSSSVFTLTPGVSGVSTTVDNSTATTINPSLDFGFTPLYSLGNRVWFDTNNDSAIGAGEVGVDNVRVELYQDNGNGAYDAGDAFLSFEVTDSTGYYRFDGLPAGNYVVLIPSSQFSVGGPLNLYWSSGTNIADDGSVVDSTSVDPDNDVDNDDNGITSLTSNAIDHVSSQAVTLGPGLSESINDNDPVTNPDLGEAPNNQSNRTVDFGFYRLELSNQIFWDVNSDGLFQTGDVVIPDAIVKLYSGDGSVEINVGPDGILGTTDDAIGGVISNSVDGTYLFGGLPEGNYIVRVTPPLGFSSTVDTGNAGDTAAPNNNYDNNDNGVGIANGEVSSNAVPLTPGIVSLSNIVTNSTGTTLNPTLDFGFIPDAMFRFSLGNRVWFDTNNDGVINGAEVGSANVRVDLFVDNGATAGVYDVGDTFVDFKTTDSNGYYRFDDLAAGNYVAVILATQFSTGGPLDGYWSSGTSIAGSGAVTDNISPDVDTDPADSDDNGATTFTANVVNYVSSRAVTLGPTANEPVSETDKLPNPDAGEEPDSQSNRTVDFGFYQMQLSDLIFVDVNNNGLYNSGDLPLAGARVQLFASNGTTEINVGPDGILGTADDAANGLITLANGLYLFSGLPAGDYIVKVTPPAGYLSTVDTNADTTTPNNNLNNNDNGVGVSAGQVSSNPVSLIAGEAGPSTTVANSIAITHNASMDFGFNVTNGFLKTVSDTSESATGGTDVTIGEIVTYRITMDLVAGTALSNVVIIDRMDKGLAFVDCSSIDIAGTPVVCSPTVSSITDPGDSTGNPANAGRQVVFNIGNIPAPATDSTLILEYRAIVLDVIENQNGGNGLNNSATVTWTGSSLSSSAPSVKIVEPDMVIDKSANPISNVPLGTPIEFTLTINHTSPQSTADAFDVEVTDVLPSNLEYVPCSITYSGWAPTSPSLPAYCPGTATTLSFTWDTFPRNQVAVIKFTARLVGTPATNSASIAWTSLDIDPGAGGLPQQLSAHNLKSTERWYDPNDNVNVYAVTDSLTINEPAASSGEGESSGKAKLPVVLPATGFAPNVVTNLSEQPAEKSYTATDVWLEIPSQGVKMPIVGVPLVNKDWDLTWLSQEAGWLEGTAFPGWQGNSALTGHVTLPNGKPGPFVNLSSLKWGDKVIVHSYGEAYIYEVRENRTIKPYSTSVLQHEEEAWLTLLTCKTYIESTNSYADRTVVRAVLVSVQSDTSISSSVNKR